MRIESFRRVDTNSMTFKQIFDLYDKQFNYIRDFIIRLGDKSYVEYFTGSVSNTITLEHTYTAGCGMTMIYVNGVAQFVDMGYLETSSNTIELLFNRRLSDEILVVISNSVLLDGQAKEYIESLKNLYDDAQSDLEKVSILTNQLELLKSEIDSKASELVSTKLDIQDSYNKMYDFLNRELRYKPYKVYTSVESMLEDVENIEDYNTLLVVNSEDNIGNMYLRLSSYVYGDIPGFVKLGVSFSPLDFKGDKGDNGFSPTVSLDRSDDNITITVNDVNSMSSISMVDSSVLESKYNELLEKYNALDSRLSQLEG